VLSTKRLAIAKDFRSIQTKEYRAICYSRF
jgi:hypothetical protein